MALPLPYNNFVSGILDSRLKGRIDLPLYAKGLEIAQNINVSVSGGAYRRTGFEFIGRTSLDRFTILKEFIFNSQQSYTLLFSKDRIEFATYDANDVFGYIGGAGRYFVAHNYLEEELPELQFAQKDDVLYICHKNHPPAKLIRTGATTFVLEDAVIQNSPFDGVDVGYPRAVCFYEGRLYYAGSDNKLTYIWGSKAAEYDNFTGLNTALNKDDPVQFDIAEISEPIDWLFAGENTLFGGTNEGIISVNGGSVNSVISPTSISAKKINNYGSDKTLPVRKENDVFYIENTGRRMRKLKFDLISETFNSRDLNQVNYDNTLGGMRYLSFVKGNDNLTFTVNNGSLLTVNYEESEGINCWTRYKSQLFFENISQVTKVDGYNNLVAVGKIGNKRYFVKLSEQPEFSSMEDVFTGDEVKDLESFKRIQAEEQKKYNYLDISTSYSQYANFEITFDPDNNIITSSEPTFVSEDVGNKIVYKTKTGVENAVFLITEFIDSSTVGVELKSPEANPLTYDSWYLTFNTLSGLSEYNGMTVSVLGDGGFVGNFAVTDGTLNLNEENTIVYVGLAYESIMKTMPLGVNIISQQSPKIISGAKVRFYNSSGVKVGTSRYKLSELQRRSPSDNYDTPSSLFNGDEEVEVNDIWDKEKSVYIYQNLPLPFYISLCTFIADGSNEV